jgi:hypothetical protein
MITCQECHGVQYELGEYPSDNLDECTCYMGVSELMDLQNRSIESQYKDATERAEKAEAKLRRIEQAAIHTAQGNCIIPSSLVLGGES